ncbi:MAG: glycosyltransferase family 39 protein [Acutalibacter sp.]
MLKRLGWLGERLAFGVGALFSLVIAVLGAYNGLRGGGYGVFFALGLLGMGALTWAGIRFLKPWKAFPIALFTLRFAIALGVILIFGAVPVQDFQTMYDAACQIARGSREYLQTDYFYNWAYQTGFSAYEALVIKVFGEGILPLQILNALWMAGTGCLVWAIARRFLPETTAMAISLLYALYPAPYFLAAVLTNQHIAVFFYYLGIWLLVWGKGKSLPRAALAGVCISLGNVMRPLGVVVILALLCCALVRMLLRRGHGVLWLGAPFLAAAVAYFISGEVFDWLIRATGLNPEGLKNNLPLWKFVLGFNLETGGAWSRSDYEAYYLLPRGEAPGAMEQVVRERLSSLGLLGFGELFWKKLQTMWGAPEYLYWGFGHLNGDARVLGGLTLNQCLTAWNYFDRGMFVLAFGLGAFAQVRWLVKGESSPLRLPLLLSFLVCGYCGVHLLIEVQSRYRYFLMPAVFLLAGAGAQVLWDLWRRRREPGDSEPEKSPEEEPVRSPLT